MCIPRIVIAGLSGGSGKTLVTLGLARALTRRGLRVKTFKKGPDYIDAAWLSLAARTPQGNIDPYFSSAENIRKYFQSATAGFDLALIEGNRGLFDGLDISGTCATSEVARFLAAPVVLVMNCTKMTRTAAALVAGCKAFEKDMVLGGVILNKTGTDRQRELIWSAIEKFSGVPVAGALPRHTGSFLEERHMGLVNMEPEAADAALDTVADFVEKHIDLQKILSLAKEAPPLQFSCASFVPPARQEKSLTGSISVPPPVVTIGYIHDAAFWHYYQENFDCLAASGAKLVPLSLINNEPWPKVDGIYFGGGVPEEHLAALAANNTKRRLLKSLADSGMPIYAEGNSLAYLCEQTEYQEKAYDMSGVFPGLLRWTPRPQGLGYVEAKTLQTTPFHTTDSYIRAHEFHFWRYTPPEGYPPQYLYTLKKGKGLVSCSDGAYDGLLHRNTHAALLQIYAPSQAAWASCFVDACRTP